MRRRAVDEGDEGVCALDRRPRTPRSSMSRSAKERQPFAFAYLSTLATVESRYRAWAR